MSSRAAPAPAVVTAVSGAGSRWAAASTATSTIPQTTTQQPSTAAGPARAAATTPQPSAATISTDAAGGPTGTLQQRVRPDTAEPPRGAAHRGHVDLRAPGPGTACLTIAARNHGPAQNPATPASATPSILMPSIIEALAVRGRPSSVACGRLRGMWTTARATARNLTAVKRRRHDHEVAHGRGQAGPATRPESSVPCAIRPPGLAFRAWPTTTHSSP